MQTYVNYNCYEKLFWDLLQNLYTFLHSCILSCPVGFVEIKEENQSKDWPHTIHAAISEVKSRAVLESQQTCELSSFAKAAGGRNSVQWTIRNIVQWLETRLGSPFMILPLPVLSPNMSKKFGRENHAYQCCFSTSIMVRWLRSAFDFTLLNKRRVKSISGLHCLTITPRAQKSHCTTCKPNQWL